MRAKTANISITFTSAILANYRQPKHKTKFMNFLALASTPQINWKERGL